MKSLPVGNWQDYLELCKPKVVALMLITAVIGMFLSVPGMVPLDALFFGSLGIALCASSAAVVNHLVDRQLDLRMARTRNRPVAQGRIQALPATLFALLLGGLGMVVLVVWVNALTAVLSFASLIGYAFVYSCFLKRLTPQNIVIGGLAGAVPPLLGWTAVRNEVSPQALLLVLIIFAWTPPHFWALAIHRREDYARAELPMLPVTHGVPYTQVQVMLYTVVMVVASLLPFAIGMSGWWYLIAAIALGGGFLYHSLVMWRGQAGAAMRTFRYSIFYLGALFAAMLIDHYLKAPLWVLEVHV